MKLIFDENEFKQLLSNLKIEKTVSGGSVANSIVGLSQLGNDVGFIGKVNDDDLGGKYEEGLKTENVKYFYSKKKEELPTGTCLILVTPDSERTMCTFLGTAGKINENDVNIEVVKNSEMIFLEGYLWDEGEPKKAFEKAIKNANKVAMSLSDQFCVDRHKQHFLDLVENKLDITFANEQEINSIIEEAKSRANEDRKTRSVIDRKNSALTLIAQAERRLRDASLEFGPYGAERQQRAVELAIQDVEEFIDDDDPQELEISVSALQEALFGLNRKFAAERKTDSNPLQGIKNTFGSLKDELFSDDYWDDDDPWDNQVNRYYRNSRYGNSRDDDPWDNDYFL